MRALALLLCLCLAACVPTLNPLADGSNTPDLQALVGVWRATEGDVHMSFMRGADDASLRLVYVEKSDPPVQFRVTATRLGDKTYLDLIPDAPRPLADNAFVSSHFSIWHSFARFEVGAGGRPLRLWAADPLWLDRHLAANPADLAHVRDGRRVIVTATTAALQAFVRRHDALFAASPGLLDRE